MEGGGIDGKSMGRGGGKVSCQGRRWPMKETEAGETTTYEGRQGKRSKRREKTIREDHEWEDGMRCVREGKREKGWNRGRRGQKCTRYAKGWEGSK